MPSLDALKGEPPPPPTLIAQPGSLVLWQALVTAEPSPSQGVGGGGANTPPVTAEFSLLCKSPREGLGTVWIVPLVWTCFAPAVNLASAVILPTVKIT